MIQLADIVLYPMVKGGYEPNYRPYRHLMENKKLIDAVLAPEDLPSCGIKYSCFERFKGSAGSHAPTPERCSIINMAQSIAFRNILLRFVLIYSINAQRVYGYVLHQMQHKQPWTCFIKVESAS